MTKENELWRTRKLKLNAIKRLMHELSAINDELATIIESKSESTDKMKITQLRESNEKLENNIKQFEGGD